MFQSSEGILIYARCLEVLARDDELIGHMSALVAMPREEVRFR